MRDWGCHCYYCGADLRAPGVEATLDHRVPRSRGGTDVRSNLVPACRECNAAKGCLTVEEYRERVRERLPEWRAMLALSQVLAREPALARPAAYRLLWACAARAGALRFPGEALEDRGRAAADPVGAPSAFLSQRRGAPSARVSTTPAARGGISLEA